MVVRYGVFIRKIKLSVFIHIIVNCKKNTITVLKDPCTLLCMYHLVYWYLVYFHCLLVEYFRIIKYWCKLIESQDHNYVNIVL